MSWDVVIVGVVGGVIGPIAGWVARGLVDTWRANNEEAACFDPDCVEHQGQGEEI